MEKIQYEHTPDLEDPEIWNVRLLSGDFVETVIQFGTIAYDEENDVFTFGFKVVDSPDESATPNSEGLQKDASEVLYDIITTGVVNEDRQD